MREGGDIHTQAKLVTGDFRTFEAKALYSAREGLTYVEGRSEFGGAKFDASVSTSAEAFAGADFKMKPGGPNGVQADVGAKIGADAALIRAQGKVEYPFEIGPFTIKGTAQGEVQAIGIGATLGGGFKTYETRPGGSAYLTFGITPLLGAKAKLGVDWSWKQ